MRAGGGFHRIDIHHGADTEHHVVNMDLYGYHTTPPRHGDLVRAWIMGPIFEGYWLDPGRSLICGNQPTGDQRALLEGAVEVVYPWWGHAPWHDAAAIGCSWRDDCAKARLLRPSAIEGSTY